MTKWQLMNMLTITMSTPSVVIDSQGFSHIGIVRGIMRESGSGKDFIIKMYKMSMDNVTQYEADVYVRTID